jgi:hypothetical protein
MAEYIRTSGHTHYTVRQAERPALPEWAREVRAVGRSGVWFVEPRIGVPHQPPVGWECPLGREVQAGDTVTLLGEGWEHAACVWRVTC